SHVFASYFFCFLFLCYIVRLFFFFFFQAEDGIRDRNVTGVQTCALPIFSTATCAPDSPSFITAPFPKSLSNFAIAASSAFFFSRSEERRVGKECRYRRSQKI